jgi:hypothetical protein
MRQTGILAAALLTVAAACASFSAGPPPGGAGAEDAGQEAAATPPIPLDDGGADAADAPIECHRARFADAFERSELLGGGWDLTPSTGASDVPGLSLEIQPNRGNDGSRALVVDVKPRNENLVSAYFEKLLDKSSCPVTVSFDLYIHALNLGQGEFVTFASIQLDSASALLLTLRDNVLSLSEQAGSAGAASQEVAKARADAWQRITMTYDPRPARPEARVAVGSQPPFHYVTQLQGIGGPSSVRFGAAYASFSADVTLVLDNFALE